MPKSKFTSAEDYYKWCNEMITRIYYSNIAMNNDAIRDVVSEIDAVLHVTNGNTLIADNDDEQTN